MVTLPEEYVRYFGGDGPKAGFLRVEPGWVQLWAPSEIKWRNQAYEMHQLAPGFLGFGSSGGGQVFAFDARHRVFVLPLVGMDAKAAKLLAGSCSEFLALIESSDRR